MPSAACINKEEYPDSCLPTSPEAIESIFILYRITGDPSLQESGWKMFQAIEKHSRTSIAHAVINDVTDPNPMQYDSMESFWTGETLKYFYLLFSEPNVISLDEYVLYDPPRSLRTAN
jgi:mannosyl-oligosaccharide alpha-1,2-mannosidase